MYGRWSHVIVSPFIFVAIYIAYLDSRSRVIGKSFKSTVLGILLLLNIGFPILGRFYSELLMLMCCRKMLFVFRCVYFLIRVVTMNMFLKMKRYESLIWVGIM